MEHTADASTREVRQGVSSNMIKLQSKDHQEILNVIDQLRSEGISKYVNLPQLIVCGDQSSGKSSVLEAISGLNFPRSDNVCTRFATELILRHSSDSGVTASIYPDDDRPLAEQERLRNFRWPTLALDRFEDIVNSAKDAMGMQKDSLSFSRDVLRVEVFGPTQPHLTMVDLPGLYHASDETQNEEGVQFVESLVLSYMSNRRSVMLAVISGKSDIALQKVTAFTRKLDPRGERTMGIITKPDTLPKGSDMERSFSDLARNRRMPFRLGWHVLKNRTFEERHFSLNQRHESEAAFLCQGIWSSMPRAHVGIDSLRTRLSTILKDHILAEMSGFIAETRSSLEEAKNSLQKLGEPRQTSSQRRRYLLHSSERFSTLISAAINGTYIHPFFGDAMAEEGYQRRLRAVIQNRLSDFSRTIRERGEHRKVVIEYQNGEQDQTCISRSDLVEEVRQRMRRSQGRELPGTFNPLIIGDLFFLHSQPWQKIVGDYVVILLEDVRKATAQILQEVLDVRSIEGLLKHAINPCMAELENNLRTKVAEVLMPHQSGHPITYNHQFTQTIQATREQHLRNSVTEKLKAFFGDNYPNYPSVQSKFSFSMAALIQALGSQDGIDMERFACSEAIDAMLSYYKVAREKFIDDFSSLAVEKRLLEPLISLYCPGTVIMLPDDIVDNIAREDESTAAERERLREKVAVLNRSLETLHQLDFHNLAAERASLHHSDDLDHSDEAVSEEEQTSEVNGGVDAVSDDPSVIERETLQADADETLVDEWGVLSLATMKKDKKKKHPKASMWE